MRVVIAEDQFLLRDGLVRLLSAYGFEVGAAVDNGRDFLTAVREHKPDVAVVDVRLPPTFTDEGLRASLAARAERPGLPILVLSQYVEQLYARELLADGAGAVGYLLKDRVLDGASFADAVRRVADGGTAMDPEVIARLLARNSAREGPVGRLSPRELEVLELMAEGRSNAAIAARLVVTERAVAKHTASIFTKLELQPSDDDNRRVLAVLAYLGRSLRRPLTDPADNDSPAIRRAAGSAASGKCDNQDMSWIDLEGAVNVRDLGGLPTSDGGSTVPGRLLRSENLQELTPRDITKLVHEIGVTTVVDLRSTREVTIEGPAPLDAVPGVSRVHHPVLREFIDASDTVRAALLTEAIDADRERYPDDVLCGHYLGYLENRPEEVTGALRAIAGAPGAAIVHCAAGKDRTGVVVALALTAAGVEPDVIVADYVATNERLEAIVGRLSRSKMYGSDVASRPVQAHAARGESMEAFLAQLNARYGGLGPWLEDNGFDGDDVSQLRAKLRQA